jgi:hypothetical protein
MNDLDFIWVLDAASAGVFKVELPNNFPENGDYEKFLDDALPKDVRLKDCSWMIGGANHSCLYQRHGWQAHGNQIA